jgi:hypothetical protein
MVTIGNNAWMYYIKKLNDGEYPPNRKCLSVKYGFKCAKQALDSLHCGITCASTLGHADNIKSIMKM